MFFKSGDAVHKSWYGADYETAQEDFRGHSEAGNVVFRQPRQQLWRAVLQAGIRRHQGSGVHRWKTGTGRQELFVAR